MFATVITGAASGIGAAVAKALRAKGRAVFTVDIKGEVDCVCDLLAPDSLSVLTNALKAKYDGVDGFVHCAGFDQMAPLGMISDESVKQLVAIHAGFPIQFLGWMSKKGNYAPNAAVVLISSLSAHEGAKGHVAYAAAKGAVEGLVAPAAAELAVKGIRLNAVVLGVVDTAMSRSWMSKLTNEQLKALKESYPFGFGKPESVAETIAFLLSDGAQWITGQKLVLDGGHANRYKGE